MKVSELEGAELDYWVAKALGKPRVTIRDHWSIFTNVCIFSEGTREEDPWHPCRFSTDWSQGGPIIERARINIEYCGGFQEWLASKNVIDLYGPTPLIAAMRCFVASKFGEEVK